MDTTPISTFLCLNIRLSVKSNSKSFIIFGNLSQNFPISLSNPFGRSWCTPPAGGVHQDLPKGLDKEIGKFCERFPKIINDLELLLTDNRIFKQRNVDIGVVSKQDALDYSFSGVMLRGSGVPWDLRKSQLGFS